MLDTDNTLICHSMMIGAKGNQVIEGVSPSACKRGNVVNMDMKIKPADDAAIIVTKHSLLFDEFPFPTLPSSVQMGGLRHTRGHAITIAIVTFLNLAREFVKSATTISARYSNFILPSCGCCKALPFDVAVTIPASDLNLGWESGKRFAADRTGAGFFPTSVIAIMHASVLMGVYESILAAPFVRFKGNHLAASTGAIDRIVLFLLCRHKSIIHA